MIWYSQPWTMPSHGLKDRQIPSAAGLRGVGRASRGRAGLRGVVSKNIRIEAVTTMASNNASNQKEVAPKDRTKRQRTKSFLIFLDPTPRRAANIKV